MPTIFHHVGWVVRPLPAVLHELLRVGRGHDVVLRAVHHVDRACDVPDPVYVGEHVAGQRDRGRHGDAVDRGDRALQHHGPHRRLGREVDARPGADGAAVEHDLLPGDADDVPEVLEGGLDVRVEGRLAGLPRAHAVAGVVVGEHVHLQEVAQAAEVLDYHAQVLRVAVAEQQRELRVAVDEEGGDHLTLGRVEPDEVRVLGVRGLWRLEDYLRDHAAHGCCPHRGVVARRA
mmetsp:Transcript_47802/g.134999  ORF Transcript_47802/g.134999 Transcript_47802/m.134999 type:complete len:232 (-) Transcript_47802:19-714(-)